METSRKIHKSETYGEAISDPVHSRRRKTVIEEEIQNFREPLHLRIQLVPTKKKRR